MVGRVCEVYDNDDNDNGNDDYDNDNNQWPVARCMVTVGHLFQDIEACTFLS